jgi:hypothetical protein
VNSSDCLSIKSIAYSQHGSGQVSSAFHSFRRTKYIETMSHSKSTNRLTYVFDVFSDFIQANRLIGEFGNGWPSNGRHSFPWFIVAFNESMSIFVREITRCIMHMNQRLTKNEIHDTLCFMHEQIIIFRLNLRLETTWNNDIHLRLTTITCQRYIDVVHCHNQSIDRFYVECLRHWQTSCYSNI